MPTIKKEGVMRYATIVGLVTAAILAPLACGGDDANCPADMDCAGITCGVDPVCGMLCDNCPSGQTCNSLAGRCEGSGRCGDGSCTGGETCASCPADCDLCTGCGDGDCSADETCSTCPGDCGTCPGCGDSICGSGETCSSCATDCGVCTLCGDGICNGTESCSSCAGDCGTCPPFCGDGTCNSDETCTTCSRDCGACPYCGDGTCNASETCSSCEADCGMCGGCTSTLCTTGSVACCPGGRPGTWNYAVARCDCGGCDVSADCAGSEVCVAGSCESAWNRAYRITVVNAWFAVAFASDPGGSYPDPYVETTIDGVTTATSYKLDTLSPVWNEYWDTTLYSTSTFTFMVYDDDLTTDDVLWEGWRPAIALPVDWLHAGTHTITSTDGRAELTYNFEPL